MEQPPPPPSTSTAYPQSHPLRPLPNPKLRLMCSYGGHIVPRPHDKSLCYVSGDTRVVAFDRRTTASTLSAITTHLSRTLYKNRPFTLKYRLPNEDLESLISVTTDEDLHNMLEEHDRIENASPPTPARIRLFLFPFKPDPVGSGLLGPKSESWFSDALKSIVQRGKSGDLGMGGELMGLDCMGGSDSYLDAPVESLSSTSSGEVKVGVDFGSLPESMGWDKSSSLGSTNSSNSMSNLPTIGNHGEDGGVIFEDKKVKLVSSRSNESDNSVASTVSHPKTEIYQDQVVRTTSLDTKVSSKKVESEHIISDKTSVIQQQKTIQVPGYQLYHQSDPKQHQQEVQYINAGGHCTPQCTTTTGMLPISPYLPMYHSPPPQQQQQQHQPYQPSQPYPMHLLPIRTTQSYQMSVPCNVSDTVTVASSMPHLQPLATLITPLVTYKEVPAVPAISITPRLAYKEVPTAPSIPITPRLAYKEVPVAPAIRELATEVYRKIPVATPIPLDSAPSRQNQQQFLASSEMFHQTPTVATTAMATASYNVNDDIACAQIYKTQPPAPPALPRFKPRQR